MPFLYFMLMCLLLAYLSEEFKKKMLINFFWHKWWMGNFLAPKEPAKPFNPFSKFWSALIFFWKKTSFHNQTNPHGLTRREQILKSCNHTWWQEGINLSTQSLERHVSSWIHTKNVLTEYQMWMLLSCHIYGACAHRDTGFTTTNC